MRRTAIRVHRFFASSLSRALLYGALATCATNAPHAAEQSGREAHVALLLPLRVPAPIVPDCADCDISDMALVTGGKRIGQAVALALLGLYAAVGALLYRLQPLYVRALGARVNADAAVVPVSQGQDEQVLAEVQEEQRRASDSGPGWRRFFRRRRASSAARRSVAPADGLDGLPRR